MSPVYQSLEYIGIKCSGKHIISYFMSSLWLSYFIQFIAVLAFTRVI